MGPGSALMESNSSSCAYNEVFVYVCSVIKRGSRHLRGLVSTKLLGEYMRETRLLLTACDLGPGSVPAPNLANLSTHCGIQPRSTAHCSGYTRTPTCTVGVGLEEEDEDACPPMSCRVTLARLLDMDCPRGVLGMLTERELASLLPSVWRREVEDSRSREGVGGSGWRIWIDTDTAGGTVGAYV